MPPLLLAVDTSGKHGSVALAECAGESCAVIEVVPLAGGVFSAQLVPQIASLLEKYGRTRNDLHAFAVATGPGSFTGLRVGLAAVKALAEALQKPIVPISLLEAIAFSGSARGRVLALLEAGRGDVYVGDYEFDSASATTPRMNSEKLLSREELLTELSREQPTRTSVVTPEAELAEAVRAAVIASAIPVEFIPHPDSAVIARLGWNHLRRGITVRPEALDANYIRHSGAEIFAKPKL
jgi:tRNA threonylcarbamoyladenosine biosynthesis protein TsaB